MHVSVFRLLFGAHVEDLTRFEDARAAGRRAKAVVRQAVRDFAEGTGLREEPELLFRTLWSQVHGTAWLTLEREFGKSFGRDAAMELARAGIERLLRGFAQA